MAMRVPFRNTDTSRFATTHIEAQVMTKKRGLPKATTKMSIDPASNRDASIVSANKRRHPLTAVPVIMITFSVLSFIILTELVIQPTR